MFWNSWTSFEKDKDYGKGAVSIRGYFGMNVIGFRCRWCKLFIFYVLLTWIPNIHFYTHTHGIKHHKHSHIRLVLREIDFPTKILQAESINQKRKWLGTLRQAREDYEKASIEQEELAELEAMAAQIEEEARKKKQEEEDKKN